MAQKPVTASLPKADNLRVPKTAELVARNIRNAIIRGELKDGDTLPAEIHLIEEYEVSRPTIREAVRILESEGLIRVSRGARGGAVVSSPGFELVAKAAGILLQAKGATIADIYEMRTIIEPPAARMVAERNSKAAVPILKQHLELEFSLIKDRPACVQAIADFHRIMIELSGNTTMTMIAHSLQGLVERHLALAQRREKSTDLEALEKRTRFGLRSHRKLVELIEARDGRGAEEHWHSHMKAAGVYWLADVAPKTVVELLD